MDLSQIAQRWLTWWWINTALVTANHYAVSERSFKTLFSGQAQVGYRVKKADVSFCVDTLQSFSCNRLIVCHSPLPSAWSALSVSIKLPNMIRVEGLLYDVPVEETCCSGCWMTLVNLRVIWSPTQATSLYSSSGCTRERNVHQSWKKKKIHQAEGEASNSNDEIFTGWSLSLFISSSHNLKHTFPLST